jgi:hypothetical protein
MQRGNLPERERGNLPETTAGRRERRPTAEREAGEETIGRCRERGTPDVERDWDCMDDAVEREREREREREGLRWRGNEISFPSNRFSSPKEKMKKKKN